MFGPDHMLFAHEFITFGIEVGGRGVEDDDSFVGLVLCFKLRSL